MVQWLRLCAPNAGGQGSIPGQGTRSHVSQLKILHATVETQCSQINQLKAHTHTHTPGDFPGSPVVKTSPSNERVVGLIPAQGN